MNEFKRGQIVYVKKGLDWSLSHYADYVFDSYVASAYLANALSGNGVDYEECLSVEDYHLLLMKPKDKDLVWCWDNGSPFARRAKFYDGQKNTTFSAIAGERDGICFDHYEVIKDWRNKPDFKWAIDVFEQLEDEDDYEDADDYERI